MFCPQCRVEYEPGFTRCADCEVSLVDRLPEDPSSDGPQDVKLVTVAESADSAFLVVAKSILDGAGIPCCAIGDRAQELIGWGRFGTGFNIAVGPVRIQVPERYADEARALLEPNDDDGKTE